MLVLHSLKNRFEGKIKLIYIDPPYNTGGDSFGYNDRFNHSTWLTFMKNRLEIARDLLRDDGVIFVQIDNNEYGYLSVLMDEIFGKGNFLQMISIKKATTAGFKAINFCPITVTEYLLMYAKKKNQYPNKVLYVEAEYNEDYDKVIVNKNEKPEKWKLIPLNDIILQQTGFQNWKEAEKQWGHLWKNIRKSLKASYALSHKDIVIATKDLHKPSESIQKLMTKSREKREKVFVLKREKGGDICFINGRSIAFYGSKFSEINGSDVPSEPLTNFWSDISWYGIADEGGVSLKNGKKPEKLLQRLIELSTEKGDIVLDFFLGSGTTCAVSHKMGRQYIGIEQLDYEDNDGVSRLKNVIKCDESGISKAVGWKSGGSFVYCELMQLNQQYFDQIKKAKSSNELKTIWKVMKEKAFLSHKVDIKKFDENSSEFEQLSLGDQKKFLLEVLDTNQLYVNLSEIDDKTYNVSKEDKRINLQFYRGTL